MIATAGPRSHAPVAALGAREVVDYHEQDWPDRVLAITGGSGVAVAVNAAPDGAGDAIRAVRDGGCLATITSDPPRQERGITVSNVYVRPDGGQLDELGRLLAAGRLEISVALELRASRRCRCACEGGERACRRGGRAYPLDPPPLGQTRASAQSLTLRLRSMWSGLALRRLWIRFSAGSVPAKRSIPDSITSTEISGNCPRSEPTTRM